jgi:hypothetical protein
MLINIFKKRSYQILRLLILICSVLTIAVFFIFRPNSWPLGLESVACLISFLTLIILLFILWLFRKKSANDENLKYIFFGLCLGLLWTIEIGINNFVQPPLPYRDWIDNIFWAIITLMLLIISIQSAFQSKNFISGLLSGFWAGFASGVMACLSALIVIVFGINYIIHDPLNIKEWADMATSTYTSDIAIYFAYQTLAGAIMHLYVLGIIWGLIFGSIGGLIGYLLRFIASKIKFVK